MSIPKKLNYIADELEKWTTCDSEQLLSWRDGFYCNFPEPFCSQWLEIIEWLRWYKPDLAKSLETNMEDVRIKFKVANDGCKGRQNFSTADFLLARISGSLLVDRLRRLSQIAKDDLESLADNSEVKSEAGTEQNNEKPLQMIRPTIGSIDRSIDKVEALKKAKAYYRAIVRAHEDRHGHQPDDAKRHEYWQEYVGPLPDKVNTDFEMFDLYSCILNHGTGKFQVLPH